MQPPGQRLDLALHTPVSAGATAAPGIRGGGRQMMHDGTGTWHWGFGFGHWAVGILFWVIIILLIVVLFRLLARK